MPDACKQPMDRQVEEKLRRPEINTQAELKKFVRETQALIAAYEQELYAQEGVSPETQAAVKHWRARMFAIIREHKDLPETLGASAPADESDDGIQTLKLLNRQLGLADTNQRLLEKSTLKLVGLDYTNGDIEKAIVETRKKIRHGKSKERRERRNLLFGFLFLVAVCLYIIVDKGRKWFLK